MSTSKRNRGKPLSPYNRNFSKNKAHPIFSKGDDDKKKKKKTDSQLIKKEELTEEENSNDDRETLDRSAELADPLEDNQSKQKLKDDNCRLRNKVNMMIRRWKIDRTSMENYRSKLEAAEDSKKRLQNDMEAVRQELQSIILGSAKEFDKKSPLQFVYVTVQLVLKDGNAQMEVTTNILDGVPFKQCHLFDGQPWVVKIPISTETEISDASALRPAQEEGSKTPTPQQSDDKVGDSKSPKKKSDADCKIH